MEWPQIQTTITDGNAISTVVDAPWVSVTSLNGMTGDVIVEPVIKPFQSNHYYLKDSVVTYNGSIYFAKQTFTSGGSFDINDWDMPDFAQEQVDWNENDSTAKSYIKNKPTIPTVNNATLTITQNGTSAGTFTANASSNKTIALTDTTYSDATTSASGLMSAADKTKLNGIAAGAEVNVQSDWATSNTTFDSYIKNKPTIGNGKITIKKNGTQLTVFTANQTADVVADVIVPTKTSDLTNDSNYIYSGQTEAVTGGMIAERTIITKNLADSAVTSAKINWDDMATKTWVPIGYAKSATSGTNLILTVNIPTAYQQASLKFVLKFELSADGWADVRCYDTSGNLIYGTYQGIFIDGGTIASGASENYTSVCSTRNVGHPYVCMQMDGQSLRFGNDGHYRSWLCRGGGGWTQSNFSFTANRDAAVGSIRFYTGGTAAAGCELKVWGMIPS